MIGYSIYLAEGEGRLVKKALEYYLQAEMHLPDDERAKLEKLIDKIDKTEQKWQAKFGGGLGAGMSHRGLRIMLGEEAASE